MLGSPDRAVMSRGLALLFGAGATFVVITLALPHRHDDAQAALLIPAGLAYVVVLALIGAQARWVQPALQLVLACGTVLIGLCVLYSGRAGGAYAFMYVWVALYASAFFTARATAAHLVWVATSYAGALAVSGDVNPPWAHWLLAVGTSSVTATLMLVLSREVRARSEDLATVTTLANSLGGASEISGEEVATAVCGGVRASTGASAVLLLATQPDGSELGLPGRDGSPAAAAAFETPAGKGAVEEAQRTGRRALLHDAEGAIAALAQPVHREGSAGGVLAVAWQRPRRRLEARVEASVALFAAEAGIALERIAGQQRDRERRALELNDDIVQGLVVAKYALNNGHTAVGEQAIAETLERARALVEGQLESLHGPGAPEPGTLRHEGRGIG